MFLVLRIYKILNSQQYLKGKKVLTFNFNVGYKK